MVRRMDTTKAPETTTAEAASRPSDVTESTDTTARTGDKPVAAGSPAKSSRAGVATGAAAVAGAVLGFVSLTGSWVGRLAAERMALLGQMKTSSGQARPEEQIAAVYTTPWHTTALFNGFFAFAALLIAGTVLLLPRVAAAGGRTQAPWVRAVAWAGVALGGLGLLLSGAIYLDVFGGVPMP